MAGFLLTTMKTLNSKKASDYSTIHMNGKLLGEIKEAMQNIKGWGTVEIVIQDFEVVQITEKNIKKTKNK